MNFQEAEAYLFSLGNEVEAMKLGLKGIRKLLNGLGKPHYSFPKVQVAGTNGKGSVCAFLNSICLSAGIKTGLYTSPHLVSITERIRIDGKDISEANFASMASFVRDTSERLINKGTLETVPTFFEQVTAIALVAFANSGVDLAILETGLGGRLDATTAANAEIVAITLIDIDHQEYLGESLAEIAAEKAAIIRPDSRVVIGDQKPESMRVLQAVCDNFGVTPKSAQAIAAIPTGGSECVSSAPSLQVGFPPRMLINFLSSKASYENVCLGLPGGHQIENAKIAILLAEELQRDLEISAENIIRGLENARNPGRLEYVAPFLFDGAHNVAGAQGLVEYLDEFVTQPITLVFGAMKGKDIGQIGGILFPKAETLILTRPENSRAMAAAEIASLVPPEFDRDRLILTETVEEALTLARKTVEKDGLILVTGSLYLVGEAKKILNN